MCGIAGVVNFDNNPVSQETVRAMANAIFHRGPDDFGFFLSGPIGLAFRRLSIIDLSPAGNQPMTNEDGSIVLIFNGEIYNFQELRSILERRGHTFRSRTDTESIIHAYEEYGTACVKQLKGMFAFALWDVPRQKLFCARDRFGIKPFYYAITPKAFIFASEVKAILASDRVKAQLNYAALNEYFTFQNILSDQTLFNGIQMLPAGHTLTVEKGRVTTEQYWTPSFAEVSGRSFPELVEETRSLFERAVRRHLISDVPVGSHSSGGMDSGSIIAHASRHIPHLMTFTGGFDTTGASGIEMFFDERTDAEIVAREFNTHHYTKVIHAGDMTWIMPRLIWHLEDLRVGMCYQNFYINELASKFVKVVLAGTGGDELFAGYPWRYERISRKRNFQTFHDAFYTYWSRVIPDEQKQRAFTAKTWETVREFPARASYDRIMQGTEHLSPINRALYFELKTFLHGLLVVEDKVSMAHSVESRVPFLDHDLVDHALSIPSRMKIRDGMGKYILRQALNPLLPKAIIRKKKQGFSAPEETWYRGKVYHYIRSHLLGKRFLDRGIFRRSFIEKILIDHKDGLRNNRLLIWSLLSFAWWCRLFLDNERPEELAQPYMNSSGGGSLSKKTRTNLFTRSTMFSTSNRKDL